MKFSMYKFKAMAPVMALFQKQPLLPFKQDYDNLRLHRQKSALGSDTARSGRCFHRNQSAVSTSHNVPSDSLPALQNCLKTLFSPDQRTCHIVYQNTARIDRRYLLIFSSV